MVKCCPQCEREFKTYYRTAIYCGKACHNASMVRAKAYRCARCGKEFRRPNYVIKHAATLRFCSHDCHLEWKRLNAIERTCPICAATFRPGNRSQRFCGYACKAASQERPKVELDCAQCGARFAAFPSDAQRGRRFCSADCARDFTVGPNHPNYRGGRWMMHGRRWEAVRRQVIARDKACRLCGAERSKSGRGLDVHHVRPRRDYLIVDIANELPNLVALCASCHVRVESRITHGRTSELPKWLRPRVSA